MLSGFEGQCPKLKEWVSCFAVPTQFTPQTSTRDTGTHAAGWRVMSPHARTPDKMEAPMRLPFLSPAKPSSEQRPLYEDVRKGIETNFKGFTVDRPSP